MRVRLTSVAGAVFWILLTATRPALAQPSLAQTDDASAAIVAALARDAAPPLRPLIEDMHLASATFRRQCLRLAGSDRIVIRLQIEPRQGAVRARSTIHRHQGRVVSADVFVPVTPESAELIAHELEHVLEQLDGIDLQAHLRGGAVWRGGNGAFETARATEIGHRVSREMQPRLLRIGHAQ